METAVGAGEVASLALMGLGKTDELTTRELANALYQLVDRAQINGIDRLAVRFPDHAETRGAAAAERVSRTLTLAAYRYDRFFTDARAQRHRVGAVAVVPAADDEEAYRQIAGGIEPLASAVAFTRTLANTPSNVADPGWMEEQARELAASRGMSVSVLGRAELEERGMGGILAVGAGSAREPRLVRLEWGRGETTVALVGKGVTFDTGGISIKPAAAMDEMKYDKSGACTVLGIARAVADLDLPLRLRVYVPLAENMPDGAAYRPGDILRCYNGKTVEITNTDAEGRLLLADALAWAVEEGPDVVLEYSTLTGAMVVALGQQAAGLYSPDDELAEGLLSSASASGERLWRMPAWPELVEQMKGVHADLKNSGGRWGGANTAAAFLSQFVGSHRRWAHLDIAGPAYVGNDREEPRGATGYGVALTVNWLRRLRR
jgi:leucyl aminopeptidase